MQKHIIWSLFFLILIFSLCILLLNRFYLEIIPSNHIQKLLLFNIINSLFLFGLEFIDFSFGEVEKWYFATLPIDENDLGSGIDIRLASFSQFSFLDCYLLQKILCILPTFNPIHPSQRLFSFNFL